jgi:hypothetical protein
MVLHRPVELAGIIGDWPAKRFFRQISVFTFMPITAIEPNAPQF